MNETEKISLRNVMVVVMADGSLTDEERRFIHRLRDNLGIDRDEFRALCEQVHQSRKRLEIPTGPLAAEKMLGLMIDAAKADGEIAPAEQRVLEKVSQFIERSASEMETVLIDPVETEINAVIDRMYMKFAEWSDDERRSHCQTLGAHGPAAVIPLLRVVESYRNPDGGEGWQMKAMIIDQLATMGDDCVVYYLAQQVSLSDADDEVTCTALREAAADAIGKITGKGFTRDAAGILACRDWWAGEGTQTYRTLVL